MAAFIACRYAAIVFAIAVLVNKGGDKFVAFLNARAYNVDSGGIL
jgi:hypothetical protein